VYAVRAGKLQPRGVRWLYLVQLLAATSHQQRWWVCGSTCLMILVRRLLWFGAVSQTPVLLRCGIAMLYASGSTAQASWLWCLLQPPGACASWFHGVHLQEVGRAAHVKAVLYSGAVLRRPASVVQQQQQQQQPPLVVAAAQTLAKRGTTAALLAAA
jgi:hypothetical protein